MNKKKYWISLCVIPAVLGFSGCAARVRAAADMQIHELEKEVARLKSERANMDARASALDDRVILLETRLKKCANGSTSHPLQVVKLSPTADEASTDYNDSMETAQTNTDEIEEEVRKGNRKSKRPVLVLNERGSSGGMPPASRHVDENLRVPPTFHSMGADNLGVVGASGGAGASSEGGMSAFNDAYRAYSNKQIDAALSGFAAFLKTEPNHAFADDAVYWRGECYLAQGKFLHAIGEFERLIRRYPASEKVASGLYRIGFSYDKLRDFSKAYEYYFKVVEKYPGTDAARRAGSRVAEIKNTQPMGEALVPTSAVR